ncbi:MAG: FMN-binding protein, partial [Xanthomonadales bacterium]|nr:FMN-binding protein [Xanthomonadales bacterium]
SLRPDRHGRRRFVGQLIGAGGGLLLGLPLRAESYLTAEEARELIFPGLIMSAQSVSLSSDQKKAIEKASKVRVRQLQIDGWQGPEGEWFILDQVIGKHENIDLAVGLDQHGAVVGIEVLTYRESYGDEVRNPRWRAQFHGHDGSEHLQLDEQIHNISGATLSCAHITDGINRLTQTWRLVLSQR